MWLRAHGREIGSWLPLLGLLASLDLKAASTLWDLSPQPLFCKGRGCPDSAVSIVYRLSDLKEMGGLSWPHSPLPHNFECQLDLLRPHSNSGNLRAEEWLIFMLVLE